MVNKDKNKEYILLNENNIINDILLDICNKENNIKLKIEELKEIILMLNEEKNSTDKEIISFLNKVTLILYLYLVQKKFLMFYGGKAIIFNII